MHGNVIAAISTPPGKGGVAVIRVSGDGAFDIVKKVFLPISGKSVDSYPPRTQIYGFIIYNEEKIDDGMLTLFPAPRSYTGEDTAEISCHGGLLVTRTVLEALLAAGAHPAEAGEFTRRAFLNGKLSLTEAEAIGTLLEAQTHEQIKLSSEPARVKLASRIQAIRSDITDVMSSIYARIDYPDEDLGEFTDEETADRLVAVKGDILELIATYRTGRAINEGISAVICGKPNVGKSTVYNLLLGEDAAIVTDIAGTTRDVLERTVPLGRVVLKLYDTAGIRVAENMDAVEKIGIERSRERINSSELIIAVFDASRQLDGYDMDLLREIGGTQCPKICLLNKTDLTEGNEAFDSACLDKVGFSNIIRISAKTDEAYVVSKLSEAVDKLFTDEKIFCGQDAIVSSARQHAALVRARDFIDTAIGAYRLGLPSDAASSDIELALGAIAEIDGRAVTESIVSDIFSKFCVGK